MLFKNIWLWAEKNFNSTLQSWIAVDIQLMHNNNQIRIQAVGSHTFEQNFAHTNTFICSPLGDSPVLQRSDRYNLNKCAISSKQIYIFEYNLMYEMIINKILPWIGK